MPFELKTRIPNTETLAAMKETEEMIKFGDKGVDNIDDVFKKLGI